MFRLTLGCLATSALITATPVLSQDFMTKKDLMDTIPGATLYGISARDGKTRWAQTYSRGRRKGTISGLWGKDTYSAKWRIKGNQWCEEWSDGSGCWKLVRIDEKTLQAYRDGKTKVKAVWNIK